MKPSSHIVLIAALSTNHVIGIENRLPWQLAADWAYFKQVTAGFPMVMGRTSAQSEEALYSDTENIILTSRSSVDIDFDHKVANSFGSAFNILKDYPRIFVIGGEKVFTKAISFADEMILTHVHGVFEGDSYFPQFDQTKWQKSILLSQEADEENSHPFEIVKWRR